MAAFAAAISRGVIGHWSLVIGHWSSSLVIGHSSLVIRHWLLGELPSALPICFLTGVSAAALQRHCRGGPLLFAGPPRARVCDKTQKKSFAASLLADYKSPVDKVPPRHLPFQLLPWAVIERLRS